MADRARDKGGTQVGEEIYFNLLKTGNPKKGSMANSDDPDEMLHKAAFHQGLQCLLSQNLC